MGRRLRCKDAYVPTGFNWYGAKTYAVKGHSLALDLAAEDKPALIALLKTLYRYSQRAPQLTEPWTPIDLLPVPSTWTGELLWPYDASDLARMPTTPPTSTRRPFNRYFRSGPQHRLNLSLIYVTQSRGTNPI
jgi:hypothetical protein